MGPSYAYLIRCDAHDQTCSKPCQKECTCTCRVSKSLENYFAISLADKPSSSVWLGKKLLNFCKDSDIWNGQNSESVSNTSIWTLSLSNLKVITWKITLNCTKCPFWGHYVHILWSVMPVMKFVRDLAIQNVPARFNTLRPTQNGCHFADSIFKCIFMNENVWIKMNISLEVVPNG